VVALAVLFALALLWQFRRGWREANRRAEQQHHQQPTVVVKTVVVREAPRPRARRPRRRP
jgi:hypothetical protein